MWENTCAHPRTGEELVDIFRAAKWKVLQSYLPRLRERQFRNIQPDDFSREVDKVFQSLPSGKQQWLKMPNGCFPGLARSSGDTSSNLWMLGQNPTTSTDPSCDMLHENCPTMGLVVQCGFNRKNTFGTDVFPLRINFDTPDYNDPFCLFSEFEDLFICNRFCKLTDEEGIVFLVFGKTPFSVMNGVLGETLEPQFGFKDIEVYLETERENGPKGIRNLVIKAPHPSNFQVGRMEARIREGQILTLLRLAKTMDECCNLAAELVGIELELTNYWTYRALESCENNGYTVGMDANGYTVSI